jgi:hypothetical protein
MRRWQISILKRMGKSSKRWSRRSHRRWCCSAGQRQAWIWRRGFRHDSTNRVLAYAKNVCVEGWDVGGEQSGIRRQVDGGGCARRRHGNRGMSGGFVPCGSGARFDGCNNDASPVGLGSLKVKFVEAIKPEGGDVDITSQTKLVSIGRGIGGKENVELAEELAEKLGATLSCFAPRCGCRMAAAHSSGWQVGFEGQAEVVSHARYLWRA